MKNCLLLEIGTLRIDDELPRERSGSRTSFTAKKFEIRLLAVDNEFPIETKEMRMIEVFKITFHGLP